MLRPRRLALVLVFILIASLFATIVGRAAVIDTANRTVTTQTLSVVWAQDNPDDIVDIRFMGSPNLTQTTGHPFCPGPHEFFGNSWSSEGEGTPSFFFSALVGWGGTGTWQSPMSRKVDVQSISSGCPGSAELPVSTDYQFFDSGPASNKIRVQRVFQFGSTPFAHPVRPYIPRLYPYNGFTQVLHPDAAGTSLVTDTLDNCDFGCVVPNWNATWFAIHDPANGSGLIVRHADSSVPATLWIDRDDGSFTNASSVVWLPPAGGFTGTLTEVEFLCFYNSNTWTPSLTLPAGC
jgi:hypothetical protein